MRVIIDPGHGGTDPGAIGEHGDLILYESEVNLSIAIKVADILLAHGDDPILTRGSDTYIPLLTRLKLCKDASPDAFVSIHCNSAENKAANGTETIFRDENDELLALAVQESVVAALGTRSRGIKRDIDWLKKKLTVLSHVPVPSCLVEVAFISNELDANKLLGAVTIAQAIANGIVLWDQRRKPCV